MSIDVYPPRGYLTQYEEGTFTVTATGFSGTAPSGTARYVRIGKQVTVVLPLITGTSNATTFTLTGMPAGLVPAYTHWFIVDVQDNGVYQAGLLALSSGSNVITLNATPAGAIFTASGVKAINYPSVTYMT